MASRREFLAWVGAAALPLAGCGGRAGSLARRTSSARSMPPRTSTAASSPAPSTTTPTSIPPTSSAPPTTSAPPPVTTSPSESPSSTPTPGGGTTPPPQPQTLAELRAALDGALVRRSDPRYPTSRLGFNPNFDGQRPAAIARCTSVADVQRCVAYAATTRTRIAARSGGHSYAGYSTPDGGLVVDVAAMAGVTVGRDGTARIGAGARLIDVYTALARVGRCLPAGSCPTVGIAGLTLGGGVGYLARSFGLTCDRLVGAEIVTADAMRHLVSSADDADLFWALRGGGGGNVGVVTSFTFRTAPSPRLVRFELDFSGGSAVEVFGAWQHWITDASNELTASCTITGYAVPSCVVTGTFIGTVADARAQLNALVRSAGAQPNTTIIEGVSFKQAMYDFARCAGRTLAQCGPNWTGQSQGQIPRSSFVATSRVLYRPVDAQAFIDAIAATNLAVIVDPIDGAVGRLARDATAFPHRGALATVQLYASGTDRTGVTDLRDRLGHLIGSHGYVNYIDPTMPDWRTAYYGRNYRRLARVAAAHDPHRVFAFAQSVNA